MVKDKDALITALATEYGLSLSEIRKITGSQFKLVADTMQEGKWEAVRLPYLGVFKSLPGRRSALKKFKRMKGDAERKSTGTG